VSAVAADRDAKDGFGSFRPAEDSITQHKLADVVLQATENAIDVQVDLLWFYRDVAVLNTGCKSSSWASRMTFGQ